MRRAFKYRLYPTRKQKTTLNLLLKGARDLYNAALYQRRTGWASKRVGLTYLDQASQLKEAREADPNLRLLNYSSCQDVLRRLHKAFDAFFRRVKRGETSGYPRFKSSDRFDSITLPSYGDGIKLSNKLYVQNVGYIRIKLHRPVTGTPKTGTLKREANKWYVVFSCDEVPPRQYPSATAKVGIDMGINSFAVLSTGEKIENPRWYRTAAVKLAKAQQSLSTKTRGTKSRQKAKAAVIHLHTRIKNQRKDFQHKLAHRLIIENAVIAVENLQPKGMVASAPRGLRKSILDAAWGQFLTILDAKAEEAARQVIRVNPFSTSSTCSRCGRVKKKTLAEREHKCSCGTTLDRDLNAALNILRLGQSRTVETRGSRRL